MSRPSRFWKIQPPKKVFFSLNLHYRAPKPRIFTSNPIDSKTTLFLRGHSPQNPIDRTKEDKSQIFSRFFFYSYFMLFLVVKNLRILFCSCIHLFLEKYIGIFVDKKLKVNELPTLLPKWKKNLQEWEISYSLLLLSSYFPLSGCLNKILFWVFCSILMWMW